MPPAPTLPIALREYDVADPLPHLRGLAGHDSLQLLVRARGMPVGYARVEIAEGECPPERIAAAIAAQLARGVLRCAAYHRLARPLEPGALTVPSLLASLRAAEPDTTDETPPALPFVSVVVCTRDRPAAMRDCLAALRALDYAGQYEVVVVDNAPTTEETAELVRDGHPWARYVRERRPGLDWARNRGIAESRGEIIAYTDDDVVVERGWLAALARAFQEAPEASGVCGLVVPYALDTEAERLFERYGGFGRGWTRRWWSFPHHLAPNQPVHHGAGQCGTGANMAFRRSFFVEHGAFDPAMDVGTPTNGGGDLEVYFRVVQSGGVLVYDPRIVIRHQHRRDLPGLYRQIADWGLGFHAYVRCMVERYPTEAPAFRQLLRWWNRQYIARRLAKTVVYPERAQIPPALVLQELRGSRLAASRYRLARERANALAADPSYGPPPDVLLPLTPAPANARLSTLPRDAVAVRSVDLTRPLAPITDVADRARTRIYFTAAGQPVGMADVTNSGHPISTHRIREQAAYEASYAAWRRTSGELGVHVRDWLLHAPAADGAAEAGAAARDAVSVMPAIDGRAPMASVVIATRDRADDLRRCLTSLTAPSSARPVELLVVDNNPGSGLTAAVVADFPGVRTVAEQRAGLSYARNAGIRAARGALIVMTDDDVVAPPGWVDALTAPFADPAVGAVTGNVLPRELDTWSQLAFEEYGGLGRGFVGRRVGPEYIAEFGRRAAPTWQLGATANAAFRRTLFDDPRIGFLDEALGAGTPTGCSEDTDLFYRILRAGWSMVYEPAAFVWHTHRRDEAALRHQLYAYSKGHVAYHLTQLGRYRDLRSAYHLGVTLPSWHAKNVAATLLGRRQYPLRLTMLEIAGNLAGPWALLRSRLRARRLGRGPTAEQRAEWESPAAAPDATGTAPPGAPPRATQLPDDSDAA